MKPTKMKHISAGLLIRIAIAIAAGIGLGLIAPGWLGQAAATFTSLFGIFLNFVIPLLIVAFVAPAISDTGRNAGRMLAVTVIIAYIFTFASGMISYGVSDTFFPSLASKTSSVTQGGNTAPLPWFTVSVEPLMSVTAALVLAFVLGFGCAVAPDKTAVMRKVLDDFRYIITLIINRVIIPLLPFYIFGIFMAMTVEGAVGPILSTFIKIIAVIFALHIGILILQYVIASFFSGFNPLKALATMLPAYVTALGTQSSAATIPVTLEQTVRMGVDRDVAGFVIPLCATIHMSGSALKIVACAVAIMIMRDMPFDTAMFAGFIAMLGITIIAAPGVPGGAIMASLGLLSSMLGFSEADNAMMIALYIAMDSFGTACNITGDGAIAQIVERLTKGAKCK